jgi:hypothetical protein
MILRAQRVRQPTRLQLDRPLSMGRSRRGAEENAPATTPRDISIRRLIFSLQAAVSDALFQKSQPD